MKFYDWDETLQQVREGLTEAELAELEQATQEAKQAMDVAEEVYRLRTSYNMTQSSFAKKVHTSQSAIARLEKGEVEPNISTLKRIARAFGGTLEIKFNFSAPTPPNASNHDGESCSTGRKKHLPT